MPIEPKENVHILLEENRDYGLSNVVSFEKLKTYSLKAGTVYEPCQGMLRYDLDLQNSSFTSDNSWSARFKSF